MTRLLILSSLLIVLLFLPASGRAAEPLTGSFGMSPVAEGDPDLAARGYFHFALQAGTEVSGQLRLSNPGAAPLSVVLAAVDGLTAQSGGSAFTTPDVVPKAAGTWLRLDTPRVTLGPGATVDVGFSVQPPPNTTPGQYLAGLAAYVPVSPDDPLPLSAVQAAAVVTVQPRYVIGVQVDVPGAWNPLLSISGASVVARPSDTQLEIALRNDGNQFVAAEGAVTVTNAAGEPVLDQPITLGTILPGTGITYPMAWPSAPAAGEYNVEVELHYAEDRVARYNGMVTIAGRPKAARPVPPTAMPVTDAMPPAPSPTAVTAPRSSPTRIPVALGGLLVVIAVSLVVTYTRTRRGGFRRGDWLSS